MEKGTYTIHVSGTIKAGNVFCKVTRLSGYNEGLQIVETTKESAMTYKGRNLNFIFKNGDTRNKNFWMQIDTSKGKQALYAKYVGAETEQSQVTEVNLYNQEGEKLKTAKVRDEYDCYEKELSKNTGIYYLQITRLEKDKDGKTVILHMEKDLLDENTPKINRGEFYTAHSYAENNVAILSFEPEVYYKDEDYLGVYAIQASAKNRLTKLKSITIYEDGKKIVTVNHKTVYLHPKKGKKYTIKIETNQPDMVEYSIHAGKTILTNWIEEKTVKEGAYNVAGYTAVECLGNKNFISWMRYDTRKRNRYGLSFKGRDRISFVTRINKGKMDVTLYNVKGKEIKKVTCTEGLRRTSIHIPKAGVYYVKIRNANEKTYGSVNMVY